MTSDVGERLQIGAEALLDARPQYLDGDGAPAGRGVDFRAVHLRDRGGGDGRTEACEHGAERLAERRGHRRFRFLLRERWHLVLQPFEIARERGADDVRPGRQELAELHVTRPELRQRGRQPRFRRAVRRALEHAGQTQCYPRRRGHHRRVDQTEHALTGEHEPGTAEPDEMRRSGNHRRQPRCSATIPPLMVRYDTRANPAARSMAANSGGRGKRRIDSTR